MPRTAPSPTLIEEGIVAVLRAEDASAYLPVIHTLVDAGIRSIELTMTTPGTLDALADLIASAPEAEIGVGTVLTVADADRAIVEGARFLVTPSRLPAVIQTAVAHGTAIYPGAMTPTEAEGNWADGATAVKLFPASTVGPEFVRHLHGPFPGLPILPSGGIGLGDIPGWLEAGAIAVSLGGPLLGDSLRGGDLDALRERARAATRAVASVRVPA